MWQATVWDSIYISFPQFRGSRFVLTCAASAEGSVSVITFDVSAIFLFFPLFFDVSELVLFILETEKYWDQTFF